MRYLLKNNLKWRRREKKEKVKKIEETLKRDWVLSKKTFRYYRSTIKTKIV